MTPWTDHIILQMMLSASLIRGKNECGIKECNVIMLGAELPELIIDQMNRRPYWWQYTLFDHGEEFRNWFLRMVLFVISKHLVANWFVFAFQHLFAALQGCLEIGTFCGVVLVALTLFLRPLGPFAISHFGRFAILQHTPSIWLSNPTGTIFVTSSRRRRTFIPMKIFHCFLNLNILPHFIPTFFEICKISHLWLLPRLIINHWQ
mmetsp:Transcript_5409/g.12285  ORF Transcript_5409/g.12285 Transcript_5409/m.12285 type:complete len:205 (+) Transcript_5409:382-996(+)